MAGLPFLAALVCIVIVLFWYLRDESMHGGSGKSGFFGMRDGGDERRQRDARGPNWKPSGAAKDTKPWRPARK
jgi:hypothetical protein